MATKLVNTPLKNINLSFFITLICFQSPAVETLAIWIGKQIVGIELAAFPLSIAPSHP